MELISEISRLQTLKTGSQNASIRVLGTFLFMREKNDNTQ